MGSQEDKSPGSYDATQDALSHGRILRQWAMAGFMRGLAGTRTELLPQGGLSMPSEAFRERAEASLRADGSDGEERSAREAYAAEVEELLLDAQRNAVERHWLLARIGVAVDILLSLAAILVFGELSALHGVFEPVTLGFLGLVGTSFIMLSFAAKRVVVLSREVFLAKPEEYPLPWEPARTDS
ncbi:hypothetical protein [Rhizobium leguminosarum]|uniref:hypothetical protein n=1 Tax=Rhizobium leguminosarum TaxID=384 RepID=UPI002E0E53B1|nr:hypothetical protein U8Q02_39905 [Rhizobium leguminosarum]